MSDDGAPDADAQGTLDYRRSEAENERDSETEIERSSDGESTMSLLTSSIDIASAPVTAALAWMIPNTIAVTQRDEDLYVTGVICAALRARLARRRAPGGGCRQTCADKATCRFSCASGDCLQRCEGVATCRLTCAGGDCRRECAKTATCSATCVGDDCSDATP